MIYLAVDRVRPGHEQQLRDWFGQLQGPRRGEAELTLREEGIRHELAVLVDSADGLLLVYAIETDDLDRARAVADTSAHPVDADHRRILRDAVIASRLGDTVLDLQV
jgi:Family of unknown function (DUF6176)